MQSLAALAAFADWRLAAFVIIQFVNVVLSTIKSVVTVSGSPSEAAVVNSVSYTFGAVVTKLITEQDMTVIIVTTLLTNLAGVWLGKVIVDRVRPERLWTIQATIRPQDGDAIESELKRRDLKYTLVPACNDRYALLIFSHSRAESSMTREILDAHHEKYVATETRFASPQKR